MYKNLILLLSMTKVEILGRYKGTFIGVLWSLLMPLIMLVAYTFVFSVVLKVKWGATTDLAHTDFALLLFVGLVVHGIFAEVFARAPYAVVHQSNYVTKIVFPLEILPLINVMSALFHSMISLTVLLLALWLYHGVIPLTAFWLPVVWLPMLILVIGIAWLLASLGVYVRDIAQISAPLSMLLLFLSPVFYPLSQLPGVWQEVLLWNPLTFMIEQSREILILGQSPDWMTWSIYTAISSVIFIVGYRVFQKLKAGFADVL